MNRPERTEYNRYYETYVSLVPEEGIFPALENQITEIENLFAEIPEEKGGFAYDEGKWTVKELVGHLIDSEKIFAYRALRIARADKTPIEGYDQDGYIENARFNDSKLADLIEELTLLRRANIFFFKSLAEDDWTRTGTANNDEISVRALAFIITGHIRHHFNILKTRYLA